MFRKQETRNVVVMKDHSCVAARLCMPVCVFMCEKMGYLIVKGSFYDSGAVSYIYYIYRYLNLFQIKVKDILNIGNIYLIATYVHVLHK